MLRSSLTTFLFLGMKAQEKARGTLTIVLRFGSAEFNRYARFVFMEFKSADDAMYALNVMNGHPFDAKHTFLVNRFSDVERFAELDETFVEPEPEEYQSKVQRTMF